MRRLLSAVLTAVVLSSLFPFGVFASATPPAGRAPLAPAAVATHLVVTADPVATTGVAASFTVTAKDAGNATDTGYAGTVHFTSADGAAVLPGDYTFVLGDAGSHTFPVTFGTVGSQTVTADDGLLAPATSGSVVVSGPATKLVVTAGPTATAGSPVSVTVTAEDAGGNTDTTYSGTAHFTSTDGAAILPADHAFVPGDAGTRTFSATLKTVGNQTITADDGVITAGVTGTISVSAAGATHLAVTTQPSSSVVAGVGLATAPTIKVEDAFNNVVTADGSTVVTVALTTPAGATLGGTKVRTVVGGVISFPSLTIDKTGSYTLTATAPGLTSAVTGTISVSAAAATHLAVTGFTDPVAAGVSSSFTVTALDAFNNIATGYTGTVHFTSTDPAAVLPGDYTFIGGDNGDHVFSGTLKTVGNQSLTADDGTLPTASQTAITVNPAGAATLVVTTQPSSTVVAGVGLGTAPIFKVEDAFGNIVTTDSSTSVTVALTTPGGATLSGLKVRTVAGGSVTFSGLSINKTGSYTLTATAPGLTSAVTGTIDVSPAAASHLAVTGFADPTTAGVSSSFTVTALDAFNNIATGYTGTVHFTSTDGAAVLPGDYTFIGGDNGDHVFSGTLKTVGVWSITASDGVTTAGSQTSINVNPAGADHLAVTTQPSSSVVAGVGLATAPTIKVEDAFNNVVTADGSTVVTVALTTPAGATLGGTKVRTVVGGVISFPSLTIDKTGSYTLTATAPGLTSAVTGTISVSAAGATHLAVTTQPSSSVVAGVGLATAPTIKVEDAFNNVVTADGSTVVTVALTTPAGATLGGTKVRTVVGGVISFPSLTIDKTGSYTLTATAPGLTSAVTGTISVSAAAATHLAVTGFTDPVAAGVSSSFTVTALDAFNNIATGYTGTVHFTSTDPAAVLPGDYTFIGGDNGDHVFSGTLKTVGNQSLTADDGTLPTASQTAITVNPAGADHLAVSASSPQVRTIPFSVGVTVLDAFGNTVTGYTGTIHFTSTDGGAITLPSDYTFTGAEGGTQSFSVTLDTAGPQTVTATDTGNAGVNGTTASISVSATGSTVQVITFAQAGKVFGDPDFDVSASSDSGLTAFTFATQTPATCTVSGATVHIVAAGDCTILASQAGDPTYAPASAPVTFAIARADQTITFTSTAPVDAPVGSHYDPTATATSGLTVTFSIDPASTAFCSMASTTVTFLARGSCLIDAAQAGSANWNATTNQQPVAVADVAPTCDAAAAGSVMKVAVTGDASCQDTELDPLTYGIATQALHGTASIDSVTGHWTYTSGAYVGIDTFEIKANDGITDSAPATISITLTNHQVVAFTDVVKVSPANPTAINVLANDNPGAGDTGQPLTVSAVTQGSHGRVSTDGARVTYDPGCYVGSDLITYTASDGLTTSTTAVLITIVRPGQAVTAPATATLSKNPIADAPSLWFAGGAIGSTVPMRLGWCGVTASGASVTGYKVYQSGNGGTTFGSTPIVSSKATSSTRNLGFNTHYAWRVRVSDSAHRTGGYGVRTVDTLSLFQDSNAAVIYSTGWSITKSSSFSGGTERLATSVNARATITLTNARGFAVVASRAKGRGSFRVYVDNVLVGTVSQNATKTQYRMVLIARALAAGSSHTIVIRPSGNGRIDLDAIVALS